MFKNILCCCGKEMQLSELNVKKQGISIKYLVEAEYTDDSHTCTIVGEVDAAELKSMFEDM